MYAIPPSYDRCCSSSGTGGLKTRIILLDFLLVLGIVGQWYLVGFWIDHLRERRRSARRWIIPAAAITISGFAGAIAGLGNWRSLELGAAILSLVAFLAWVALFLMFAVTTMRWAIRSSRTARATGDN